MSMPKSQEESARSSISKTIVFGTAYAHIIIVVTMAAGELAVRLLSRIFDTYRSVPLSKLRAAGFARRLLGGRWPEPHQIPRKCSSIVPGAKMFTAGETAARRERAHGRAAPLIRLALLMISACVAFSLGLCEPAIRMIYGRPLAFRAPQPRYVTAEYRYKLEPNQRSLLAWVLLRRLFGVAISWVATHVRPLHYPGTPTIIVSKPGDLAPRSAHCLGRLDFEPEVRASHGVVAPSSPCG